MHHILHSDHFKVIEKYEINRQGVIGNSDTKYIKTVSLLSGEEYFEI